MSERKMVYEIRKLLRLSACIPHALHLKKKPRRQQQGRLLLLLLLRVELNQVVDSQDRDGSLRGET